MSAPAAAPSRRSGSVPAPPQERRLEFLDALRGVAVGLVLAQHVGELVLPSVHRVSVSGVQLGQLGVMVFFLCSGFIIPASLDRTDRSTGRIRALRSFWWGRAFRLFPMYWISLAGALLLTAAGRPAGPQPLSAGDWLANTTMVQGLLGAPHALGLYWTLTYEMAFYGAVSVLYAAGLHRRSVALSLAASGGCAAAALLCEPLLGRPAPLALFCLATMFTGTVFHRWHTGAVGLRTLIGCVAAALGAGGVLLFASLGAPTAVDPDGTRSLVPMLSAWLVAYAIFCAGVALRSRRVPRALRELGRISYSVYLVQALVLLAVPPLSSAALTIVVWAGSVLGISVLTHRFVELPAVALGRRWAGSVSRPAAASAARSPAAVIAAVPVIPAAAFPAAVPAPRHPTTPSVRELTRT